MTARHIHTPDDGDCGYCAGSDECPFAYCPYCPKNCGQRGADLSNEELDHAE